MIAPTPSARLDSPVAAGQRARGFARTRDDASTLTSKVTRQPALAVALLLRSTYVRLGDERPVRSIAPPSRQAGGQLP